MISIVFKSTRLAVTRLTTVALLLLALAACNAGGSAGDKPSTFTPIDLVAKGVDRGIDLSWNKVTGAKTYTVYYSDTSFSKDSDQESDITTDNTSITGLINGTKYYLLVEAINADGSILSASRIVSAIANLPTPTKFKATGRSKAIDLSWGAVKGATKYTVYHSKARFSSTTERGVQSTTDITTDNTSITGLTEGTTYYFRVIAINSEDDNSKMSPQIKSATIKLRAPKPSAAASINNPAAVDLTWNDLAGVTDYRIYYAKDSLDELEDGYKDYLTVGGKLDVTADTRRTIGDLSINTTYYFVVVANYGGEEIAAQEVSAKPSYIAELAMGGKHGCVRLNTGRIKCWGRNDKGQLGVGEGDTTDRHTATSVGLRAKQLSAGFDHSCAIDSKDKLQCWGSNQHFKLGLSKKDLDRTTPTPVTQDKLAEVSLVTAGYSSTCALIGGNNYCWGSQRYGGLGDGVDSEGSTKDAELIKVIKPAVKQFALGFHSGCARDASNHLWCWGYNAPTSQVGDGNNGNNGNNGNDGADADLTSPVKVLLQGGGTSATMLSGGYFHYCVVVGEAKKIQCWGANYSGQLGIDSKGGSNNIPQYVLASPSKSNHLSGVSKIATGEYHSCALIANGEEPNSNKVRCWGEGGSRIGTDTSEDRKIADTDMQINNAIDIAAGADFTCALLADKASVKCWGLNNYGQLGDDTTSDSHTPAEVAGLRIITIIPEAPTKLQAIGKNKAIDLTWGKVDGAISYTVYYHTEKFSSTTDNEIQSETVIAATSTSITGLKNGTEYFIRIVASNTKGNSALSKVASATTELPAPTNLNAIGFYKGVDLSWDAVTGATSYKVYYHTASFDKPSDSEVQSTAYIEEATKTSITGLDNGQTYYFKVVAHNNNVKSEASSAATGTPNLNPPTGLKASSGYKSVALSWNAVSGVEGYRVYYHTDKEVSPDKHLVSREVGSTSITISGLTTGVTYYFIVLAYKNDVNSKASEVVTGKPIPSQPTGLQPTSGYKSVALSWNRVSGVDGYRVYYDTTDDVSPSLGKNSGSKVVIGDSSTDTTITGLNNGQIYYFIVVAYQGSSSSSPSLVVSAEPSFAPPTNLNATGVYQAVDLSWDAVTEATSYTVYYHTTSFDNTYDSEAESKTGITTTNTRIKDLTDNTTYYFGVIASNPSGSSKMSQIKSATTKLAPHPSAAASISLAAVDLSWDAVDGVSGYNIYYAKDSLDDLKGGYKNYAKAEGGNFKTVAKTDTSITIGDLSADTTYYFVVAANYNGAEVAAPEVSADSSYIAELAMGGFHSCVRLNSGSIKCWGSNYAGQLGLGDTADRHTATGVSGLLAKQLSAGHEHSCAIGLNDRLYCWGDNDHSQLGLEGDSRTIPTWVDQANLAKEVSLVTAGRYSTCAVAAGNNYCWGGGDYGGLGNGEFFVLTMTAQPINDITPDVKQFALGDYSGCAIDASDDLWCWGNGKRSLVKPKLQGSGFATMLAGKYFHYCVVDNAKKIQCWGWNYKGQLGIGSTASKSTSPQYVLASPKKSDHLSSVSKIAIGDHHSCVIIANGEDTNSSKVRCWGDSDNGKIGDTTTDRKIADTDMPDITNAIDIAAGGAHTCVLLADRASVKCWGSNYSGQLGNDKTADSHTPVAVLGLTDITKLPISIPAQPTKPQATGKNKAIDLSWDAVAGATSYKVYYHTASFSSTAGRSSKTVLSPALSTSITRLKNGKEYFIRLVASNAKGDSKPSGEVSATTKLPAPINLNAIGVYQGVDLSWDAVEDATSYTVYYRKDSSFDSISVIGVKSETGIKTTYTSIKPLTNGQTYYFKVVAYIGSVPSQLSIVATGTPNLNPPTGLKASSGYESVDLSWNAVSGVDGYRVYYHTSDKVSPDKHKHSGSVAVGSTSTTISGLATGVTYYFIVLAYKDKVNSKASEVVTGTPILASPTELKATSGYKSVALSWNRVPAADEYTVYYHTSNDVSPNDNNNIGSQAVRGGSSTDTTISGLTNGQTYYFIVVADKDSSSSLPSLVVSAEPSLAPPTKLQANGKNTAIDLTWDAVAGATTYTVYYHTAKFQKTSDSGVKSKTGIKITNTSIASLTNGTKYYLRVEAISASGETKLSTEIVSATANLLSPPTNLNATGSTQRVDLTWDAVTGATRYTVYYHTASFDKTTDSGVNGIIVAAKTNISVKRLANGTTYYFRVIAVNPNGNSALSQIQSATTTLVAPRPSAAASIISPAAVDLSWDAVAGATGYTIYYAKVSLDDLNGGYKNYRTKGVGGKLVTTTYTRATIGDLPINTTYYFVVATNYKGGEAAAPELSTKSSYIAELAMGGWHGCVRLNSGGIKCWGRNNYGQLGVDDTTDRLTATSVPNFRAKQLSAGKDHSCAIDLRDMLHCWGSNKHFKLGLSGRGDDTDYRSSPKDVTQDKLASVSLVSAGWSSTCAVAGGNNYCWGRQVNGGLGNGVKSDTSTPIAQEIDKRKITSSVKQFAVGIWSSCAIDAIGVLWCWGDNSYGQVGDGITKKIYKYRTSPVKPKLQGSSFATMLAGKYSNYCVVDNAKKIQCWGNNSYGQLGINRKTNSSNRPQYVLASKSDHLTGVGKIATGVYHSCALIKGGMVHCWGVGRQHGIIGTDATTDRLVADTDMPSINNAIDIAAGSFFTCVLLDDRARVKCWGYNTYGQLGDGRGGFDGSRSHTPVAVKGL